MPSIFHHLSPHRKSHDKSRPRSPRSPKSPSFSKTEKNFDGLDQCAGCRNVEILIRRNIDQGKNGLEKVLAVVLHNSFYELDKCSRKCQICRVFRQALVLEQVTFDGVKELSDTTGEVKVRWNEVTSAGRTPSAALKIEIKDYGGNPGVVTCNSKNTVGHLALVPNALDPTVIAQAKDWLYTCLKSHTGQCDNLKWSSENPQLLVEILSPDLVRLCENQKDKYVALSYCWGNMSLLSQTQRNEVERGKTLLANLNQRRQAIRMSELPTTVRDALLIIHEMGLKYAWVDTLCIVQDKPEGVATMHKVYSNALFTLCACATTHATAKLLDQREAWTQRTEPCRLGGQWLTTPDMSLNELRLRSPLAERAWTLQEERLSPRMLYVSSNRIQWSCAVGHEMEMKPTYGQKEVSSLHRPVYAASDRDTQMPLAQDFLLACYSGTNDLHGYWADIVKSYAMRSMSNVSDRLTALSGLAAKYLSASKGDEYLAGLWANQLGEGLAWRVYKAVETGHQEASSPSWPSWSWAVLPLQTAIEMNSKSAKSPFFQWIEDNSNKYPGGASRHADDAIKLGEQVKQICVTGRLRRLWRPSSRLQDWHTISRSIDGEEKFSFAANPEQDMHAVEATSGRVLIFESRKREIIGQLDFQRDVRRAQSQQIDLWAFEIGVSNMLLLERYHDGTWRRVGVAWNVREDYFTSEDCEMLILR